MVPQGRALAAAALLLGGVSAKIHNLKISNDPRYAFSIESFGFYEGGTVSIHVKDVSAVPGDRSHMMGFVLYPTTTESRIAEQIDLLIVNRQCALDAENEGIYKMNVSDPKNWLVAIDCGAPLALLRRESPSAAGRARLLLGASLIAVARCAQLEDTLKQLPALRAPYTSHISNGHVSLSETFFCPPWPS